MACVKLLHKAKFYFPEKCLVRKSECWGQRYTSNRSYSSQHMAALWEYEVLKFHSFLEKLNTPDFSCVRDQTAQTTLLPTLPHDTFVGHWLGKHCMHINWKRNVLVLRCWSHILSALNVSYNTFSLVKKLPQSSIWEGQNLTTSEISTDGFWVVLYGTSHVKLLQ